MDSLKIPRNIQSRGWPNIFSIYCRSHNIKSFIQNIKIMFYISQDMEECVQNRPKNTAKYPQQSDKCCEIFLSTFIVRVIQKPSKQNVIR